MSRLLDALRRGDHREPPRSTVDRDDSQADTVLATLGYSDHGRERRQSRRRALLLAGALSVVVLGVGTVALVNWLPAPPLATAPGAPIEQRPPEIGGSTRSELPPAASRDPEPPRPAALAAAAAGETIPRGITGPAAARPAPVERQPVFAAVMPSRAPVAAPLPAPRPPPTSPAASSAAEDDHFKLAVYYQRAGDLDAALLHYRALFKRNELNAEAHNNLGLLYQQKGLREDALREFQRAILIEPHYAKAHNNLGVVLLQMGNADAAAKQFDAVLAADAKDVDALINLALAQKALGQAGRAQETLLRAIGIQPGSAAAHYNIALLYEEAREMARAIEHYRAFLTHAGLEHAALVGDVRKRVDTLTGKGP